MVKEVGKLVTPHIGGMSDIDSFGLAGQGPRKIIWEVKEIEMGNLCKFFVYFMVLALPALAGCTRDENIDERALYAEAQKAMDSYPSDQEGLEKAEKLLNRILRSNRKSAYAQTGLGRLAYKKGYINYENYEEESLAEAHSRFEKALRADPSFFDAWYYGAYPYIYEKKYPQAKALAEKARAIEPDSPRVDLLFAEIAQGEGDTGEVERRSNSVIEKAADNYLLRSAYSNLTWVHRVRKEYDLADKAYQKIIELDPASPWAKINYSSFLVSRGNYDRAIDYGKQALDLMDFGMGHHVLGNALCGKGIDLYWKENRPDEAKGFFEEAVQHAPDNADAYYGLGMSYYNVGYRDRNVGDLEKGKEALKRALQLNPDHPQAKSALNQLDMLLSAVKK